MEARYYLAHQKGKKSYLHKYWVRREKPKIPSDEEMPQVLADIANGVTKIAIANKFGITRYLLDKRIKEYKAQQSTD